MSLWLPRGSGLVERFTPPELSLEAAVERSWRRREGGRLLEPKPPVYLRTYAMGWGVEPYMPAYPCAGMRPCAWRGGPH